MYATGKDHHMFKHGHTKRSGGIHWKSPTYHSWLSMKQRCLNANDPNYHNYGGRGVCVHEDWMKFENFLRDMGDRPDGHSLDRINVNGSYCSQNCRWLPVGEQNNNTRRKRIEQFSTPDLMNELGSRGEFVF